MADPVTIGLLIAGTTAATYGAVQQGRAADVQAKSEQDILNYNAEQKRKEAADIRDAAQREAEKFGREARRFRGTQRVNIARGGVLVTGTPAFLLEETAQDLESDRLAILEQGALKSEYAISEAYGMRFAGTSARARGKNIKRGANLSAAGTLLTGLGTAGYYNYSLKQGKTNG